MTIPMLYSLLPILIVAFGIVLSLLLIAWQRSQKLILVFTLFIFVCALLAGISPLINANEGMQITDLLRVDNYGTSALCIILIASTAVCLLSSRWLTASVEVHDEYFVLIQLVVLGAGILVMSDHFAALFLGFELLSISLVGLVGYGKNSQFSVETSFKYLILSACASSFMLLGIAFIYSQTGTLSFSSINTHMGVGTFYQAGMVLFLVGVAFKLSLAPFHFWTPDVYQGSPIPITLLLASVSKVAMFVVLMKCWFSQGYVHSGYNNAVQLPSIMTVLAVTSMFFGNALALKQQNIKRLLAYSSIAHMGYLLIVLLIISPTNIEMAWQGALFYLSAYVLATVSIFTALGLTQAKNYDSEAQIQSWQGLFWHQRSLALLIIIAVLSLAGIPLSAGFIGKFYLLNVAVQAKQWWLIGALIVGSGIGLYYYLNIIFVMFHFKHNNSDTRLSYQPPTLKFRHQLTIITLMFFGVYFGIFPDTLSQLLGFR